MTKERHNEIVNRTVELLEKQGVYSFEKDGMECLYRGPDVAKCAAGHWIPDEKYSYTFEGLGVVTSWMGDNHLLHSLKLALEAGGINGLEEIELLGDLQGIHDKGAINNKPFAEMLGFMREMRRQ